MKMCVTLTQFLTVTAAGSLCRTTVDSRDLGCVLRWVCPGAGPHAAYTVQTKTQGDPWEDVAWCVRISSQSCDLSQAFSHFDLYNTIRLGLHHDPTTPAAAAWTEPHKFDYSDLAFSAPSVSLSLGGDRLRVRVQFPCAANRRCSRGVCCPLSELIDPWTSVTVYNPLNPSDHKRRTVWSQEVVSDVEFSGLAPGQHYCAVANFSFPSYTIAASPPSTPRCVETDPHPAGLEPVLVGAALCSVLTAPFFILFLLRTKRHAAALSPENQPKAQASPRDTLTLTPPPSLLPVDPCDHEPCDLDPCDLDPCDLDPCDIHLELIDDHGFLGSSSSSPGDLWKQHLAGMALPPFPSESPGPCGSGAVAAAVWNQDRIRDHTPGIGVPTVNHSSELNVPHRMKPGEVNLLEYLYFT